MEQPSAQNPAKKKNFDFVDTIRCIAMMGIVFEHCTYHGNRIFPDHDQRNYIYIGLIQLSKFGTIAFFLLAGFLLGDRFQTYSSWQYFKRRLSSVFLPWLIWSLIFITATMINLHIVLRQRPNYNFLSLLVENAKSVYLYTNYWFIINFMFCIGILLCFKRHLYKWWLGLVFCALSFAYSLNVYFEWFATAHTVAIFGFVFYLWLGAQMHKHWEYIDERIRSIPLSGFICGFIVTFAIAQWDSFSLSNWHSQDPFNTLRFSNVLYSFAVIMLLFKVRNISFLQFIRPRETTFGIYLIHYILIIRLLPELLRPLHLPPFAAMSAGQIIVFVVVRFFIIYSITLLLIKLIAMTRLRWIVGR
ncbi:acyltransferase [Pedobacter sp. SYP-B3415]|uniref:acyltransferase family protein n=1 Tax=Pedobacter sp. SYP-B3415 TaxID=2496641 RepID=UPI00101C2A97|nr:acyltransferase [Pedobacter sp. SYP-B3415]